MKQPPQFKVTAASSSNASNPKRTAHATKAGAQKPAAAPAKPATAALKTPKTNSTARANRRASVASTKATVTITPIGRKSTRPKTAKTTTAQTTTAQQRTVVVPPSPMWAKLRTVLLWIGLVIVLIIALWFAPSVGKWLSGGNGNNHSLPPPPPAGRPANVPPAPGQPVVQSNVIPTNATPMLATFNMHDNATVNMSVNGAAGFNMSSPTTMTARPWPIGFTNYVRVDIAQNAGMQAFVVPPHSTRMFMVAHGWRADLYTVASRDTYRMSINGIPPEQIDPNKIYEVRSYLVENLSSEELTIGFECIRVP